MNTWLSRRIQDFAYDRHQAVAGIGRPTVELEKVSNAQNPCFWIGIATHEGLEVSWGIRGTAGNRRFIKIADCVQRNPALELQERMQKKLKGAYSLNGFEDNLTI